MPKSNGRKVSSLGENSSTDDTTSPAFPDSVNYIQNGSTQAKSAVSLDINFSDFLQLRGKSVHEYIKANGTTTPSCIAARFTDSAINKIVVIAAIPRSYYNFSTKSLEYYFNIAPAETASNMSYCQKTGIIVNLSQLYPGMNLSYKFSDLCQSSSCLYQSFTSRSLELFNASGVGITQINLTSLFYNITNYYNPEAGGSVTTCTETSTCKAQGYDCCSSGQCVTDLSVRSDIDKTSQEYIQALQDILNNPAAIYNYPEYYNLCSSNQNPPTNPGTTPTNPVTEAQKRLEKLKNLYTCANSIVGEMGICSVTHPNVSVGDTVVGSNDDRTFHNTLSNTNATLESLINVEEVKYGEVVVFDYTKLTLGELTNNTIDNEFITISAIHNDDLSSPARVFVKKKPSNAQSNEITIKYKNDASCTYINTTLVKCEKHYVQDQDSTSTLSTGLLYGKSTLEKLRSTVTDHYPATVSFNLPFYANTAKTITVHVDGITQHQDTDWTLVISSPARIEFSSISKVSRGQKVKISYYANLATYNPIVSKLKAQDEINGLCSCTNGVNCNIMPIVDSNAVTTDYACVYPNSNVVDIPLSQKFYLSSKSVPVRFFDITGSSYSQASKSKYKQEGSKAFEYRKNNLLNPNNSPDITDTTGVSITEDHYVGFSEIYGSLSTKTDSAKPAYEINIKKGKSYDIYVDKGSVSTCLQCGTDYYSNLTKIFPLTSFGSGLEPDLGQTNRVGSSNTSIRSDDLKFGRACMLPATMIPWTHTQKSSVQSQRLQRMAAQHFLYANGYQFDWYGFDYGAVIGSFDGVRWFAIGTNRRIKADTNKLYVAVNAPFGDLTIESTFEVTVNDASLNTSSNTLAQSDYESNGAQCQQFHQCSTDNDCATTLGWEYACAPVGELTSAWPKFDDNANEIAESSRDDNRLTNILGTSVSGKRCVYRGRGALCSPNANTQTATSGYTQTATNSFHSCSSANYCQSIYENGVTKPFFNNKIVRTGKASTDTTKDSFGLGAQIPGRPYKFNGNEAPFEGIIPNLVNNKSISMCIPGKNVSDNSFALQNKNLPSQNDFKGDRVLGIGQTLARTIASSDQYLSACSIFDDNKNFFHNTTSTPTSIKLSAGSQAISTNALLKFKEIFQSKSQTFDLIQTNLSTLSKISYTESRCLRAPGASCFSDMDCAPSKTISDKIKSLSALDATTTALLNKYEILFWQEELVCSQAKSKTDITYDPKNNRCCRDIGKTVSLPSADELNQLDYTKVAGIDQPYSDRTRYSRASTMYKTMLESTSFPELRVATTNACASSGGCVLKDDTGVNLDYQYKTFASFAENTSCSGHWVRNFSAGGHKWDKAKFQTFQPKTFKCYNWMPKTSMGTDFNPDDGTYSCANFEEGSPYCPLVQTLSTSAKAKEILSYFGRLELMGIPQIALESKETYETAIEGDLSCLSDPAGRTISYPNTNHKVPTEIFSTSPEAEYSESNGSLWYSAADTTNFNGYKTIFKSDEIATCQPAGTLMKAGDDASLCCTGNINSSTLKCQMPDYIDLSVYTNRYVSSEAKAINPNYFDKYGFIKDPAYVAALACQKQMCSSGVMATGVLISKLKIPGQASGQTKYYRFLEGQTAVDDVNGLLSLYNNGLKLNNHLYCIPQELAQSASSSGDLTVFNCN